MGRNEIKMENNNSEYQIRKNEDGDIIECSCCQSEVPLRLFPPDDNLLCKYCGNTFISNPHIEYYLLKQVLAQMFNILEEELVREVRRKKEID